MIKGKGKHKMHQCDYCDFTSDSEDHFEVFRLHVEKEHPEIVAKYTFDSPVPLADGIGRITGCIPTHHKIAKNSL